MRSLVRFLALSGACVAVAAGSGTIRVHAQPQQQPPPPAQTPQQPAAPAQPDQYTFTTDTMMLAFTVAEAGATDFEVFMGRVKDAMNKSDKPERKQQAASWKMLLKLEPANNGNLTYLWVLDPVAKGVSYDLFKILGESMTPEDVKAQFDKIQPVLKGINMSQARIVGPVGGMQ